MKAALMRRARLLALLLIEFAKVVDCLFNVLLGVVLLLWAAITGQEGEGSFSGETLSARAGRAHLNGKWFGRVMVPVIDLLFAWQSHELELPASTAGRSPKSNPTHRFHA